jgi:hypothetical protein
MTSFPIPHNYANHILVASPSNMVRQRVLESLRSPVRRFEQAAGGAEALVHLESGFWQVLFLDRRDEQGLSRDGNNDFSPTLASGQPAIGAPTSGVLGSFSGGALEQSTSTSPPSSRT